MKNTIYQTVAVGHDPMAKELMYTISSTALLNPDSKMARFTRVYEEQSPALLRFCTFKLSNKEKAIDLVSDTFMRTWQYLQQGNIIENEKSFLYTTARHLIIDEYRKKKNISLEVLISAGFEVSIDGEKDIYSRIDNDFLVLEVSKLPSVYRSIIIMRYVNDLSVSHISKLTGNSQNNISVKIHRGILKLREILETRSGSLV